MHPVTNSARTRNLQPRCAFCSKQVKVLQKLATLAPWYRHWPYRLRATEGNDIPDTIAAQLEDAKADVSNQATYYVSEIMEVDRSFELLIGLFDWWKAKQPQEPVIVEEVEKDSCRLPKNTHTELATFGGGCFWCTEACFQVVKGVVAVTPGYAGGIVEAPTYEEVSEGTTGHAEVIRVEFDPAVISYHDLLMLFFKLHDPTTLNRQGNDEGTQYRSIILYHSVQQKEMAEQVILELQRSGEIVGDITTELVVMDAFWPAEEKHQNFYNSFPNHTYSCYIIAPKMADLYRMFPDQTI